MEYQISIKNWDKYNPRKDTKHHSWFKFYNDTFLNPKINEMDSDTKVLFFVLLCLASQKKNKIDTSTHILALLSGVKFEKVDKIVFSLIHTYTCCTVSTSTCTRRRKKNKEEEEECNNPAVEDSKINLIKIWNEHRGDKLPIARSNTGKRARAADALLQQNGSLEYWQDVIKRISQSSFLAGNNKTNWVCNIDFFLRPDTHVKVMEGVYDDPKKNEIGKPKEWDV